ncbi:MAG TPA: NUDIX domain-containing protein [Candidatus Dormibacteraeota bacterium]|nr:NUDIX domain-containing protein [Candidatus Dormibacteraeota bacterium]
MKTEFRFCPTCGAALGLRQIEGRDLPACPNCDFVAWKGPKVATALIASDPDGRLLVIRRGISPGLGGWAFPGGYVDDDEDPAFGAARECREETGCDAQVEELAGVFHVVTEEGGLVVLAYRGRLTAGQPTPTPEAPELGCFDPGHLPDLVFSSHRRAFAAWQAANSQAS